MVAHRFLLAALILSPWALTRPARFKHLKESAILAVLLSLLYVSQTVGLAHTTASNSGFITGLFVIFVPLFLLVFFGRPPTAGPMGFVGPGPCRVMASDRRDQIREFRRRDHFDLGRDLRGPSARHR